eukprot:gb/GECG01010201.1/.p1 GENE.gb/GECG01010201.1/~~gb/GECG01010201.1/.p1  ORF type:complete len:583 (+),score=41.62 gb/GECG01010201.1/:1-1749(+)
MWPRNSGLAGKRGSVFPPHTPSGGNRVSLPPIAPLLTCLIGFTLGIFFAFGFSSSSNPPDHGNEDIEAPILFRNSEPLFRSRPHQPQYNSLRATSLRKSEEDTSSWPDSSVNNKDRRSSTREAADPQENKKVPHTSSTLSRIGIPQQPAETDFQEVGDDVTFCDTVDIDRVPKPPTRIKYMHDRFLNMYEGWKSAVKKLRDKAGRVGLGWSFSKQSPLTSKPAKDPSDCSRKRILIYIGTLLVFNMDGLRGKPQGGLLQWTDLYAALVFLGYDVHVVTEKKETSRFTIKDWERFDLVLTDYAGAHEIGLTAGTTADTPRIARRCKFRILDTFGTQDEFNMAPVPREGNMFCCLHLDLRQYFTFIPDFAPENTFLGYAVPHRSVEKRSRNWQGLIWAKNSKYFVGMHEYLRTVSEYIPLISTLPESQGRRNPGFITNKGLQSSQGIHDLYEETAILIGLGTPFNGPSGIEAVTHGTAVVNIRHNPPASSTTHKAMDGKPTRLGLTSQHPFLETYVGEPWVYTVDPKNLTEVREAMKKLKRLYFEETHPRTSLRTRDGYIPYSYSEMGFLERVFLLVEYQDLCQ